MLNNASADRTGPNASVEARDADVRDRFRGCLLAGAAGDALGAPVEFLKLVEIRAKFGPDGIRDFASAYGRVGAITDDTQMTLFTAEAMLRGWVRGNLRGIGPDWRSIATRAYLRWLLTQGERSLLLSKEEPDGWLIEQRQLHSRRAPGNTCLGALHAMKSVGEFATNDSKGCGGVMRVAPVGMFFARFPGDDREPAEHAFDVASELARITHGHPSGYLSAGALACLVAQVLCGATLSVALERMVQLLRRREQHEETLRALESARELAASGAPHDETIRKLGRGWTGEEALAISVYCALVAPDLEHAVAMAVNHDGDSDSTGSITGNLVGARDGIRAIPERWLKDLELVDVITAIADDLADFPSWPLSSESSSPEADRLFARYPGW